MEIERLHERVLVGGREERSVSADRYADDLAVLHRVSTLPPADPDQRLAQWLDAGVAALDASQGVVILGTGRELVVRGATATAAGSVTLGDEIVDRRISEAVERRATIASLGGTEVPAAEVELGTGSLVASPLWVSGRVAGAVAFLASPEHPPYTAWALALVDLVADGVARVLEHQADTRELYAVQSHAEAMIDLIPDPIVRLDRTGRRTAAVEAGPFDPCEGLREAGNPADEQTFERLRQGIGRSLDSGSLRSMVFATRPGRSGRRVEARFVPASPSEVLCIVRDITDRYRAEQALAEQVAFEALVTSLSTRLISCPPAALDEAIVAGLGEIASFFAADAAFIDELSADGATLQLSHLWTRPGQTDDRRRGQRVDLAGLGWLTTRFERGGHVFSRGPGHFSSEPDMASLADPDDLGVLWVRLGYGGDLAGVVGLTWRTCEPPAGDEVLGLVRFAADAFDGAIRRRSVALLAQGQAEVFEGIARREPVATSLLGARDLLGRHTLGATVVVATVDDGRLGLVSEDAHDPWVTWFAALPLGLDNPYGQAVITGEPVAVADARRDPRFGRHAVPDPAHRSVSVLPVRSPRNGRTLAVFALFGEDLSATTPRPSVLTSAVSLVTVALEREIDLRRLAHQATHDPLTGVGNRAALLDRLDLVLARARRTARPVAVLYCDLDGFKAVNDQYGHDRGDRLLVEVADRIRRAVRPSDTVSRSGGDEFVVVCEDLANPEQAGTIVDRVRAAVEGSPIVVGDVRLEIVISIGLALADPVLDDPDRLLRTADLAMYESKARGRHLLGPGGGAPTTAAKATTTTATTASASVVGRRPATVLEIELTQAIADGGLDLHQQPLVGRDGSLAGVEVLLRWPKGSELAPGPERIVASAVELGLAPTLGRWVRRRALTDRSHWEVPVATGERPPVHVNVSGAELIATGFVESLLADLRTATAEPDDLVLEVREEELLRREARAVLTHLDRLGFAVLVDRVGQGGLPLAELATLPVRGIKIGPPLVRLLDADPAGIEVVRSLVLLAHGLGWHSLAVGVETDQQRAVLFGFGIDAVQGRAVTMPVDAEGFRIWLGARDADR